MRTLLIVLLLSVNAFVTSTRISQDLTVSESGTSVELNCQTSEKLGLVSISIQSSSPISYFVQPLGFPEDSSQLWTPLLWKHYLWDYDVYNWTNYQDGRVAPLLIPPPTKSPDPYASGSQARLGITCQISPCVVSLDITYQCAVNPNWYMYVPTQQRTSNSFREIVNSTCTPACGQSTGVIRHYCSLIGTIFVPKITCQQYGSLMIPNDSTYICEDYQLCDSNGSTGGSHGSSSGQAGNSTDQMPNGVESTRSTSLVLLAGVLALMMIFK